MLGSWTRGVEKDDVNENTWYNNMPEGADGLLSVGDTRGTTFGSQSASVLAVDQRKVTSSTLVTVGIPVKPIPPMFGCR